jgi:putative holliday junction resolvase
MSRGKILGVDYGSKNVGIACSDELRLTVEPLPSVPNRSRAYLLSRLQFLVQEMGICEIVIGLPVNMDGSSGEAAVRVGKFMEALEAEVSVPVHGIDERLSTIEALEVWNTLTPRRQRRYGTVDSLAAAFILERFLKET